MHRILHVLDRCIGGLALAAACVGVAIMVAITGLILVEVVLRSFFATSTQIVEEYVGYGLGAMIFLGLGQALRRGVLVRVDLVLGRLSRRARRAFEIAIVIVTLAVMIFIMHFFWMKMVRNYARGTISMTIAATPIWIPEAVILCGMAIFVLSLGVYLLRLCLGGPLIDENERTE